MMFKKASVNSFLSFVLSICMIFTIIPISAYAAEITDISNHWGQDTIQNWVDQELIQGYPDGSFKPDNNITRAEFIVMVNKVFGFTVTAPVSYTDVNVGAWYYNSIEIAVAAGYINGYPDGTMRPENFITREEVATVLMSMNKLTGNNSAADVFKDAVNFTWSKGAIGAVFQAKLMEGYPDGSFGNRNFIKRGEALVALDKTLEYVMDQTTPEGFPVTPIIPLKPAVTRDDNKNTVSGMLDTMEYKLDSGNWTPYVLSTFEDLDLGGDHILLVRYAASGVNPFGPETRLTFKANTPISAGGGSSGGSSGSSGTSSVEVSAIIVKGTGNTTIITTDNGTLQMVADVQPTSATIKTVTWSVINGTGEATISNTGLLKAVADGTVTVKATAKDGSGVYGQLLVTISGQGSVIVDDIKAPVITLIGSARVNVLNGSSYTDKGATATDNIDGDITSNIVTTITNNIDTGTTFDNTKAATYTYHYNVSDAANNAAYEVRRTVIVAVEEANENQGAPTEELVGIAPTSFNGNDGKITGTTTAMEYRLSSVSTWTKVTRTEIIDLTAGFYEVRYAAKDGFNEGIAITIGVPSGPNANQDAPQGLVGIAPEIFGGSNGKITGTTNEMEYRLTSVETWTDVTGTEITGLESGFYDVRYAAKDGFNEGTAATLTIPAGANSNQEAPEGLAGIAPETFGGSDGKITGTTSDMEYRLLADDTWTKVTGSEIQDLEAGFYDVRYAARPGFNEGPAETITVSAGPNGNQDAPEGLEGVAPTTLGGSDGKITGATNEMEYRLLENDNWTAVTGTTGGAIEIIGLEAGFYDVRYVAIEGFDAGLPVTITVPAGENENQGAPTETLIGVAPTTFNGSDGKIIGTTSIMEYRLLPDGDWATAAKTETLNLITGFYDVRYAAKEGFNAGYSVTVGVAEGPNENQAAPEGLVGIPPTTFDGSDGRITGTTNKMEYRLTSVQTWTEVEGTEILNLEEGWYDVRYAAIPGFNEGVAATIGVPPGPKLNQAAPEGLITVSPTTFGGDDGKITGTTTDMEYRTLLDDTWKPVMGSEISGLKAGFYYVRFVEKPGYNVGDFIEIYIKEAQADLNALAIDGIHLVGFAADIFIYNIELPAGTTIVPIVTATALDPNAPVIITAAPGLPGKTIILVTAQDGVTEQIYTINFVLVNEVPLGLKGIAPTIFDGTDGKITGTSSEMQYRPLSLQDWTDVTGTEINNLAAGTYLVRYKVKDGYALGASAYVVVPNPNSGKLIFTFDDGWKDTIEVGKPILDTAGFKATVYVNRDVTQAAEYGWSQFHIDSIMDYNDLHELYDDGWDVGNHSTNHLDYKRTTDGVFLIDIEGNPLEWQTPEEYGLDHPEIPEEQVYTEWLKTLVAIGSDTSEDTIARLKEVYEDNQFWLADDGPDRLGKLVDGVWTLGYNLNMPLSAYHIAYPSGLFSDDLVTMIDSIGAETGRATTENNTSNNIVGDPDFFRLPVQYVETELDANGKDENLVDVLLSIDYAVAEGSTVILMLHRVGTGVAGEPGADLYVSEASFKAIVDYAKGFTTTGELDVMTISQWYNLMK